MEKGNIHNLLNAFNDIILFSSDRYKSSLFNVLYGQLNKDEKTKYLKEKRTNIISKLNNIDKNNNTLKDILYKDFWENELKIVDIELCKKKFDIINYWFYLRDNDCKNFNNCFSETSKNLLNCKYELEKRLSKLDNDKKSKSI